MFKKEIDLPFETEMQQIVREDFKNPLFQKPLSPYEKFSSEFLRLKKKGTLKAKKSLWKDIKKISDPELENLKVQILFSIGLDRNASLNRIYKVIESLEKISCDPRVCKNALDMEIWAARQITYFPPCVVEMSKIQKAWERIASNSRATFNQIYEAARNANSIEIWEAVRGHPDIKEHLIEYANSQIDFIKRKTS
jgi:hypothetical protein